MSTPLWRALSNLAAAPASHLDGVARAIESLRADTPIVSSIVESTPPPSRHLVAEVLAAAQSELGEQWPLGLAPAIRAVATVHAAANARETVELVWTGPKIAQSTFRRTDRAWIDLIDEAARSIWLASYSTSPGDGVQDALDRAICRGVDIRVLLETPLDSSGRMSLDGLNRFRADIRARARFYRWPLDERKKSSAVGTPQMHAKCIVVDESIMLVTSANLSGAALERNIEVGVVVKGGPNPAWLAGRFDELLESGTILEISSE